jgi:spermidine synthase
MPATRPHGRCEEPGGPATPGPPGPPTADPGAPPTVLDRRSGPHGEVVLRRHGALLQIIANGTFLMDTSDGRSERLLVTAALAELEAARGREAEEGRGYGVLIGGLGVGFSLAEAAARPRWSRITVVEREQAVIDWHGPGGPLSELSARALADERTQVVHADLVEYLRADVRADEEPFDALCLDIDNGPDWTVTDDNASLYSPSGLAACAARLAPGGVLAVWSAQPSRTFEDRLAEVGFERVRTEEVSVVRGVPDVVHFATKPA